MKKRTEKPKVQTRFAKYKAIEKVAKESIESIEAKTEDLDYIFNTLLNYLDKRLKDPKSMSRKDRVAAEKRVAKDVKPISIILDMIVENLDPAMQKKFEEIYNSAFKNDKAFDTAMTQHMKGQKNSKMTTFLGRVSQLIVQQDGSRVNQLNKIRSDESVKQAEKVTNNPLQKVAHILRPGHMSSTEALEKKKGKRSLFSRSGDTREKTTKPKVKFFDKMRRGKNEKGTGKGLGKK